MSSVVYVSCEPSPSNSDRDFSSASRYGAIEFVLPSFPSPSAAPRQAMIAARKKLANFNPNTDYVAFGGGDPMSLFIVGSVLASMGHPYVTILRWERERSPDGTRTGSGFYLPSTAPIALSEFSPT